MEQAKKVRAAFRRTFTRTANHLDELVTQERTDLQEIQVAWELLQLRADTLQSNDKVVFELLLGTDASEEELTNEITATDEYTSKLHKYRIICQNILHVNDESASVRNHNSVSGRASVSAVRKYKLPVIEFKKFGGDLRDWLPFWSQFKKINDDEDIALEDKFQYLIQATISGTRARELVESFPPTGENYSKAVDSLRSRFGRDDLLVEVYVRELLKLVLNNAGMRDAKRGIAMLYDRIETQLRALETLGVTTDKCAAILYPLVESCLPEDLLRVWQRSSVFSANRDSIQKSRLEELMTFLKAEVESEERILLAVEGFGPRLQESNIKKNKHIVADSSIPTAAVLMSNQAAKCVFCDGVHGSEDCFKAQKMSLSAKRTRLAEKKACFFCLKIGHLSRKCKERLQCLICSRRHVVLMCPELPSHKGNSGEVTEKAASGSEGRTVPVDKTLANHTDTRVFLQTLRVRIRSERAQREVRVVIDTGSQRSYILQSTAEEMGYVSNRTESIVHALFGGTNSEEKAHSCYDIRLASLNGDYCCRFEVLDQPTICLNISSVYDGPWMAELRKLKIAVTDTLSTDPIEVLIGADVAGKLLTGRRRILQCGLVTVETLLGWVLMGKVPVERAETSTTMTVTSLLSKDNSVSDLWKLDVLGIADPGEKKSRMEVELAVREHFLQTITVNREGRYEVGMPWIEGHPPLPSNYALALKRLESVETKLRSNGRYDAYGHIFKEWVHEGILEEVAAAEMQKGLHYLPHRPVIKESSRTTKIRPVFDASANEKGKPSLNQCLEKGPNLIERIPELLLQFRRERIGVVADIRKAFLQISLNVGDRDFLRFLWRNEEGNIIIYRHKRVVFGISCSPFLLGATLDYHLQKALEDTRYSREVVIKLMRSFYVDNCVTSVSSEAELHDFIDQSTQVMLDGKFDLREWEYTDKSREDQIATPVLGLVWDRQRDVLSISSECFDNIQPDVITKRVILSIAQRLFDPIGFTCPTTLCPKLILQETWQKKIGWDVQVDAESEATFRKWFTELPLLRRIQIPRWIQGKVEDIEHVSLHTFCDASQTAYAAVIFLRVERRNNVQVYLLQAKARIAPIKKLTIPRLELLAATIAARLYVNTKEVFEDDIPSYFWSDSSTVISWIRCTEEWSTFVWNRTAEIRSLTSMEAWRHVPGVLNPADLPSRGCDARQLLESKWWEGPSWLYGPQEDWPRDEWHGDEEEINKEKKKKVVSSMLAHASEPWYCAYFSHYNQVVRLIAWMNRFVKNCRDPEHRSKGELSTQEMNLAEQKLLNLVQRDSFEDENDKSISSLRTFKDEDGLIRLKTKISRREDAEDFRFPFVLPAQHPVVKRLIWHVHMDSCHVGTQGLLGILRERYWILGGRRTIRSVISKCPRCKRFNSKKMDVSEPPLPMDRVRDAATFEVTGVDLAGPLYLKNKEKGWICLFTCGVYRAIHLELLTSLSTSHFLQALRRFVSRRGRPYCIYSDNGTNFVGAENAFKQLDWETIMKYSTAQRIIWRFNPPTAAWWGGWWERLIGLLKQLLRRVLGRASLTYEELLTVLCDCEAVINARPLTYVSSDAKDLITLTPAMFLRDLHESGVPDCDEVDTASFNRRIKYVQKLREDLRRRFRNEYLGQLKLQREKQRTHAVSVGDVVLVSDSTSKRLDWPLGRVVELLPGPDGEVRLIRLQTAYGQLLRPIQNVYCIECIDDSCRNEKREEPSKSNIAEDNTTEDATAVMKNDDTKSLSEDAPREKYVTRSGRVIKVPQKYIQ